MSGLETFKEISIGGITKDQLIKQIIEAGIQFNEIAIPTMVRGVKLQDIRMSEVKELSQLEVLKNKKSESTENARLEALKKKREQINARIQKIQASEKSKLRKEDTRRKIIVGAYIIDQALKEEKLDQLYSQVKSYCTRDSDKVLF